MKKYKKCSRCHQLKSVEDFQNCKSTKDGLQGWCRACKAEYAKNRNALLKSTKLNNKEKDIEKIVIFDPFFKLFKIFNKREAQVDISLDKIISISSEGKILSIRYKK